MRSSSVGRFRFLFLSVGSLSCAASVLAFGHQQLTMDPSGAAKLGYYPVQLKLSSAKPRGIRKEPAYKSDPKYGAIRLGDGPKSTFLVVADEPKDGDWKLYIDRNQNGDLTDDGDGAWTPKRVYSGRTQYGVMTVALRASYGSSRRETSFADYAIGIYAFADRQDPFMYRQSARTGLVEIGGASHKALLVENDADAVFDKHVGSVGEAGKTHPVWLLIDKNDDGKYSSGQIDVRGPFEFQKHVYEAMISHDGSKIDIRPTTKAALDLTPKAPAATPLLKSGTMAPDFTAEKWGGGNLKLADYRGKVVILDFWATWCGPCQKSMPHIEKITQMVKNQDVAVVGVCVWDTKEAYNDWMPKNREKYSFQFAFDPAGKNTPTSIAMKLFHVNGIPTTYIIDKDGKVVDSVVGYDDGDTRLEQALKKIGVQVK